MNATLELQNQANEHSVDGQLFRDLGDLEIVLVGGGDGVFLGG
jgi:hypothetical protein